MYLAGHPLNERDGLYRRIGDPAARAAVTVALAPAPELEPETKQPAKRAMFDIVLGMVT
jgi:protocatechuate 3,4-dioxygenase beta subunit